MTTAVLKALAENPVFAVESLTDAAAADLGGAIGLHLDAFGARGTGVDGLIAEPDDASFPFEQLGGSELRFGPNVSLAVLAEVVGQVAGRVDGAITLRAAADSVSTNYFAAIGVNGSSQLIDEAIGRASVLSGLMDGGGVGARLGAAERNDIDVRARIEALSDGLETLLGLLPVPGGAMVEQGAGVAAGWAASTWAESYLSGQFQFDAELARSGDDAMVMEDRARFDNAVLLYGALGPDHVGGYPPFDASGHPGVWAVGFLNSAVVQQHYDPNDWYQGLYEPAYSAGKGEADDGGLG